MSRKPAKQPVFDERETRRIVGLAVTARTGFARFHAVYERTVAVKAADGITYVLHTTERGRSIALPWPLHAMAHIFEQARGVLEAQLPAEDDVPGPRSRRKK